ncbi:UNKNOWN [Stylonychia lemnae]|uniref:Basal body-orientation factor 1 n=1 Tax=Stylonychia lemnae TaxID=5949 RepID=A0A078ASD3_STYLE|nr:UNKNOWN [Stylonychia lemnae]|eukprot:CDW85089.1 UNKNOWN [Stylonychia lemnae]
MIDKERIDQKIKAHDDEKLKITRTLQSQVDEKAEKIAKNMKKLEDLEQNSDKINEQLRENFQRQLNELTKKQEAEIYHTEHQMNDLSDDLQQLDNFKKNHRQKEDELEAERMRYEQLQKQLQNLKEQGRLEQVRLKQRIEDQYAKFLEDFKKRAQSDAEKNISEIERNIQAQNQRLEDEVLLQQYELEFMEKRNRNLGDENKKYNDDLRSKQETVEEYAKKQYEQNNKIKMLKTKIELLEKRLSDIVQNFEKEKELLKFQNEQIIKEQSEEIRTLRESIRLKSKEIKNLKALCQMILDQRSDIEQFFLEALEQVKEEKRRKLLAQGLVSQPQQPQFLPLIDPQGKFGKSNFERDQRSSQVLNEKRQVELADLDWEDRERVLRLMFSKMNTGQPASNWRVAGASRGNEGRTSAGIASKRTGGNDGNQALNQSFREDEEGEYDQEVDEADLASNTNIFRKTNADEYGGSVATTKKGSQKWE